MSDLNRGGNKGVPADWLLPQPKYIEDENDFKFRSSGLIK
jgi:hypothetical protein